MPAALLVDIEGKNGVSPGVEALRAGSPALDVVETAIKAVELDESVKTVGLHGGPNILGVTECDASIMDGATMAAGTVGALTGYRHPIAVARQVMERLPHVMLVGEGAMRFAREVGAEKGSPVPTISQEEYWKCLKEHIPAPVLENLARAPLAEHVWAVWRAKKGGGTTIALAQDRSGSMAGGVSTSGSSYKYPGRLGDSPVIGAGLYVDNRFGGAACTHTGEMTIRAGTARAVVAYMKKGASVKDACYEALEDLRALRSGYLGPVVVHALDNKGEPFVLSTRCDNEICYWFWSEELAAPECRRPAMETL